MEWLKVKLEGLVHDSVGSGELLMILENNILIKA